MDDMTKIFLKFSLLFFLLLHTVGAAFGQREITREEYIATYAPLAIEHHKKYGIPASVKMAQAIIESSYGNSELARKSNNHFGIKCKNNWTGEKVYHDDDALGECFRCYTAVEDSFRDHSEFLKNSPRYAGLFELKADDYKGWAHGLKRAGYATSPTYASVLIKCIEDWELYLLDEDEYPLYVAGVQPVTFLNTAAIQYSAEPVNMDGYAVSVFRVDDHGVFLDRDRRFIVAREGDTFRSISRSMGIAERRLRKYNGATDREKEISSGDRVYIENS